MSNKIHSKIGNWGGSASHKMCKYHVDGQSFRVKIWSKINGTTKDYKEAEDPLRNVRNKRKKDANHNNKTKSQQKWDRELSRWVCYEIRSLQMRPFTLLSVKHKQLEWTNRWIQDVGRPVSASAGFMPFCVSAVWASALLLPSISELFPVGLAILVDHKHFRL